MKEIDYKQFYKNWYKKIPMIRAIVFAAPFLLTSVLTLLALMFTGEWLFATLAFPSLIIGLLGGWAVYFFSAVSLSQKIIVVEELKKINKNSSSAKSVSDEKDDLPQI